MNSSLLHTGKTALILPSILQQQKEEQEEEEEEEQEEEEQQQQSVQLSGKKFSRWWEAVGSISTVGFDSLDRFLPWWVRFSPVQTIKGS